MANKRMQKNAAATTATAAAATAAATSTVLQGSQTIARLNIVENTLFWCRYSTGSARAALHGAEETICWAIRALCESSSGQMCIY